MLMLMLFLLLMMMLLMYTSNKHQIPSKLVSSQPINIKQNTSKRFLLVHLLLLLKAFLSCFIVAIFNFNFPLQLLTNFQTSAAAETSSFHLHCFLLLSLPLSFALLVSVLLSSLIRFSLHFCRTIQCYMGDRYFLAKDSLAEEIVNFGIQRADIRDELYLQLLKVNKPFIISNIGFCLLLRLLKLVNE